MCRLVSGAFALVLCTILLTQVHVDSYLCAWAAHLGSRLECLTPQRTALPSGRLHFQGLPNAQLEATGIDFFLACCDSLLPKRAQSTDVGDIGTMYQSDS